MSRLPVSLPRPTKHFGRRALLVIVPIPIPSQEDIQTTESAVFLEQSRNDCLQISSLSSFLSDFLQRSMTCFCTDLDTIDLHFLMTTNFIAAREPHEQARMYRAHEVE
jgi:hypothetical protein